MRKRVKLWMLATMLCVVTLMTGRCLFYGLHNSNYFVREVSFTLINEVFGWGYPVVPYFNEAGAGYLSFKLGETGPNEKGIRKTLIKSLCAYIQKYPDEKALSILNAMLFNNKEIAGFWLHRGFSRADVDRVMSEAYDQFPLEIKGRPKNFQSAINRVNDRGSGNDVAKAYSIYLETGKIIEPFNDPC